MKTVRSPIEVDVTYVNKRWYGGYIRKDKTTHYVIGFFQREGDCIIKVLENNNPETIKEAVFKNIQHGAILYCEENILPNELKDLYEIYELRVSEGKHINGSIHVNNVKNMWKDLKRKIKREHVSVSKKHLQLYCSELAWGINNRHLSHSDRFNLLLTMCATTPKKSLYKDFIK